MSKITGPIQLKRGSGNILSETQKTTILAEGEPFYHKGAEFVTIGDGDTSIENLPKIGVGDIISISSKNDATKVDIGYGGKIDVGAGGNISIASDSVVNVAGSVELGQDSSLNGSYAISIGKGARANGGVSLAIGWAADAGGSSSTSQTVVIGPNASAIGGQRTVTGGSVAADNQIIIGANSVGQHRDTVAIGHGANAWNDSCIAIGGNASTGEIGYVSVAVGANATSNAPLSIALGNDATTNGNDENQIAIGTAAKSYLNDCISIGTGAVAGNNEIATLSKFSSIAIGSWSNATAEKAISIGSDAKASGVGSIAIGNGAVAEEDGSISIGHGYSRIELGSNKFLIGGNQSYITTGNFSNPRFSVDATLGGVGKSLIDIDKQSVSIGMYADVNHGSNCIAIGYNAKVPQVSDVGSGSSHPASNTVQLLDRSIWQGLAMYVGTKTVNLVDSSTSDARLKQNVTDADTAICLADVNRLKVSRFEYKPFVEGIVDKHRTGWMADDVEKVFKNAVYRRDDTFPVLDENGEKIYEEVELDDGTKQKVEKRFAIKDVQHIEMETIGLPTLWGAVQELSKLVSNLQKEVDSLKEKLNNKDSDVEDAQTIE